MKILLTGASGFLGSGLAKTLVEAGHQLVLPMRRKTPPDGLLSTQFQSCSIPDIEGMTTADWLPLLEGVDAVIHAAAIAHIGDNISADRYQSVNRHAARKLAEAAARTRVSRFIFVSSIRAQVGRSSPDIQHEELAPMPTEAYGQSKLDAERDILDIFPEATVFRPVLVLGEKPKGNLEALLMLARLPLPLPLASLDRPQAVVCRGNLISAIALALTSPVMQGETFCVADARQPSLAEIIRHMRRGMNRSDHLFPVPEKWFALAFKMGGYSGLAERILCGLQVDAAKLRQAGWVPQETPSDVLERIGQAAVLRP